MTLQSDIAATPPSPAVVDATSVPVRRSGWTVGAIAAVAVAVAVAAWALWPAPAVRGAADKTVAAPTAAPAAANPAAAAKASAAGEPVLARTAPQPSAAAPASPTRPSPDNAAPPTAGPPTKAPTAEQLGRRQALRDAALAQFAVEAAQALARCPVAATRSPSALPVPHRFAVTLQRADAAADSRGQTYVAVDIADPASVLRADAKPCLALLRALPVTIAAGDLPEERLFTQFVEFAVPGAMMASRDESNSVQPGVHP